MNVVAIVNRGGGTVKRLGLDAARLRAAFAAARLRADVWLVEGAQVQEAAREAVAAGTDVVVAGGGDGTISAAAGALAGTGVPLGVLPLGTFNHFARDLGIPFDLGESAQVVAGGATRAVDVGEVNGRVFVNNAALGFYPAAVAARRKRHSRLGRALTTAAALGQTLLRLPILRVRIIPETGSDALETAFIFVGTNAYALRFAGFGAEERASDGRLHLYVARCASRPCLLRLVAAGLVRDLRQDKHVDAYRAEAFDIATRRRRLKVFADGELLLLTSPLRFRVRAGALRVLVPPPPGA